MAKHIHIHTEQVPIKLTQDAGDLRIKQNKLLGGWYIVRGSSDTPIGGRFSSKEEAEAHLEKQENARNAIGKKIFKKDAKTKDASIDDIRRNASDAMTAIGKGTQAIEYLIGSINANRDANISSSVVSDLKSASNQSLEAYRLANKAFSGMK